MASKASRTGRKKPRLSRREISRLIERERDDLADEREDAAFELTCQVRDLLFSILLVQVCPHCEGTGHDDGKGSDCRCRVLARKMLSEVHEASQEGPEDPDEDDEDEADDEVDDDEEDEGNEE